MLPNSLRRQLLNIQTPSSISLLLFRQIFQAAVVTSQHLSVNMNTSNVGLGYLSFPSHLLQPHRTVIKLTKLKIVDNSENSRRVTRLDQPYCIKLPKNQKVGKFGDVIKIAHRGKIHNALIVSNRKTCKWLPRYDHHNIILLNDKLEPVGTRILGPIPTAIRRKEGQFSKVIAIATKFI